MKNGLMIPEAVVILSWISLLLSVVSFIYVAVSVKKNPQKMKIMNLVWPLTTLFGSLIWVLAYKKWGQSSSDDQKNQLNINMDEMDMSHMQTKPMPISVFIGTCHCGAGCTLADLIIESLLFLFPSLYVVGGYHWIFSNNLYAGFVLAFILAYIIGVSFQYFAIVPMKHLGRKAGVLAAIKADTLSLTSWQVGMYAVVAFCQLWLFPHWFGGRIEANSPVFWFMMQLAMLVGFCTAYPMNWFLIKTGIKERM